MKFCENQLRGSFQKLVMNFVWSIFYMGRVFFKICLVKIGYHCPNKDHEIFKRSFAKTNSRARFKKLLMYFL
jgi:hypothetical protein